MTELERLQVENAELKAELKKLKSLVQTDFAARLRLARKTAGLTQEDLARRLGLKRSTYGQFEQGRNEPNISILPALVRELNYSANWFLGLEDE